MPRDKNNVCHIAIATHDLGSAIDFYVNKLGCKLARQKEDRVTFNFFGVVLQIARGVMDYSTF